MLLLWKTGVARMIPRIGAVVVILSLASAPLDALYVEIFEVIPTNNKCD